MADDSQRPIIIKRIKKNAAGHHGGAWKIAYADFVTAMMAFFLLMWLLGSTTKGELQGIADYFQTPLKVSLMGGTGAGDRTSPLSAGGRDLTRSDSLQQKRGEMPEQKKRIPAREAQAEVAALACSSPPPGAKRWSVALLTQAARRHPQMRSISRESIRRLLKKTSSSPGAS